MRKIPFVSLPWLPASRRKHGENARALRWIELLEAARGENSVIDQGVQTARKSIDEERAFQRKAVELFEKAEAKPDIEYMAGELHRRLGNAEAAAAWFDKAIARNSGISKLAKEQKALLNK